VLNEDRDPIYVIDESEFVILIFAPLVGSITNHTRGLLHFLGIGFEHTGSILGRGPHRVLLAPNFLQFICDYRSHFIRILKCLVANRLACQISPKFLFSFTIASRLSWGLLLIPEHLNS
jgi:hypothetical protein